MPKRERDIRPNTKKSRKRPLTCARGFRRAFARPLHASLAPNPRIHMRAYTQPKKNHVTTTTRPLARPFASSSLGEKKDDFGESSCCAGGGLRKKASASSVFKRFPHFIHPSRAG